MANQPLPTVQTQNQELNRIQSNVANALNGITGPFIGGKLLTGKAIATTATVINHGLGRTPQVWVICDQDTLTNVKRSAWDSNSITLLAGATCIVSLWVN